MLMYHKRKDILTFDANQIRSKSVLEDLRTTSSGVRRVKQLSVSL